MMNSSLHVELYGTEYHSAKKKKKKKKDFLMLRKKKKNYFHDLKVRFPIFLKICKLNLHIYGYFNILFNVDFIVFIIFAVFIEIYIY